MSLTMQHAKEKTVSVTAVIVLYERTFADAVAFETLELAFLMAGPLGLSLQTILYDNTPYRNLPENLPEHVVYRAAPENRGLAEAYNWAIDRAEQNGSEWLLTLDQDTRLPPNFLLNLYEIAAELVDDPTVAAIVPQIVEGQRILSPYHFKYGAIPVWYPTNFQGLPKEGVFAFNSAALVRVSTLRQINGYNPWFWLDQSDAFLFRQLQHYGKQIFVAGHIHVEHNFSMLDMKSRVSTERYRNILLAETAFWDLEMSSIAATERLIRLLVRLGRQILRNESRHLRQTTQEFVWRRIFWTKKRRLQAWREETQKRFPLLTQLEATSALRISVCMATYNGCRYIELQLRSILKQLGPGDELILIDDASSDSTVDLVRSLLSAGPDIPKTQFIIHPQNKGVGATFEEALRRVNGDLVIFADQDDIWVDNKVISFRKAFEQCPELKIVTSLITVIDEDGNPVANSAYSRTRFHAGFWHNLLRNRFQGSAMSMRASMIGMALPFPRNVIFLHDYWIGIRNAWAGGAAVCLPEPLLLYRRHSQNVSGRMPLAKQLKARLQLLWRIFTTVLRGSY